MQPNNEKKTKNGHRILEDSPTSAYAKAKALKLVTAVHMITRHIKDDEPLRTKLRSISLEILSAIMNPQQHGNGTLGSLMSEIMSLLDVASGAQYISETNTSIVRREYGALAVFVEENGESFATNTSILNDDYFDVPLALENKTSTNRIQEEQHKVTAQRPLSQTPSPQPVVKDNVLYKGQKQSQHSSAQSQPRKHGASTAKKNARRDAILDLFKDHKGITVKDATEVVPNVSEKTLQRELVALVEEGVLRKEGERRWSTYYKV